MKVDKIPRGQTPERQAYMKQYTTTHPKRDRRAYKTAYDEAHKEENIAYRIANAERIKANKKAYYQANRDRILAYVKARALADPAAISEYHARHYIENAERIKQRVSEYSKRYPEKSVHLNNRRRAKKVGNGGSHTKAERDARFAEFGNVCFYCGKADRLTADHDLPIVRGGTDNIDNILPACKSCNSRKHTRTATEFLAIIGR